MSNEQSQPVCPWCGDPIRYGESSQVVDGEPMHLHCAAEEEDDAFFDRDMGFGDN